MELGIGIGWRPEIAETVERLPGVDWVEVVAENLCPGHLPASLTRLLERGTRIVPHGVSLGLGGADRPSPRRLADLAERAEALDAPLVTEHIAFVRAGGALTASPVLEAGHLLPVPRTWDALAVLCENVRIAQDALPVPLALENIAALISWPDEELTEGQFLAELVERTGVRLLIDVANLHTNHVNRGEDPSAALDALPVEAIAYVHVAGGVERDGLWHDTHAHPVTRPVLDVLADLRTRVRPPGVLLERDDDFPAQDVLASELSSIRETLRVAAERPTPARVTTREGATPHLGPASEPVPPEDDATLRAEPAAAQKGAAPARAAEPSGTARPITAAVTTVPMASAARTPAAAGAERTDAAPADGRTDHPAATPERARPACVTAARERLGLGQAALVSALVAGTPAPEGFDARRLRVQSRALMAKRADIVAKVAPELPGILGRAYRPAFLSYAKDRPLQAGYRGDALDFAGHLLATGRPEDAAARRRLTLWWQERAAPRPPRRAARIAHAARAALAGIGR
ncbi:DUF692 domain-containing protein [Streptomyces sp. ISL-10]|uniref:DUF692 domain-containing protein n=1 Tax=Streptomyces sp. ISL-10 TaxID=2819172 RepID=UPI001BEA49C1|nr:DUF692 domain-containing protein [Streptomyces sp. ISL-10]MBT2364107.1 DUF692 domain-containing protein [Streptomyces sp. ISL-10]